ncbi:hypothetical protein [Sulfurimonas hydrogeniphila]|uniref:hypothetical protein n=1 Tax=Sulfurimonas hydrogeniphila TaxID=2509341 RepID=UPI00125F32DE|nr:hypothetical protein [Sulfurimonas hydrogeniphila]
MIKIISKGSKMTAPIIEAKKVIETLLQESSYDEIIRELAFDRMIKKGLQESKKRKLTIESLF